MTETAEQTSAAAFVRTIRRLQREAEGRRTLLDLSVAAQS